MRDYRILHFATHGLLQVVDGLRSSLALTPEPPGSAEDGFLEAREILSCPLKASLAVLSACHSAQGQKSGGEGLLGLAWAFRAAGCPAIVGSQWQVNDKSTELLMKEFYSRLKRGSDKDEALRAAMIALRRNNRFANPHYWAAFQLIGDTGKL
jgi:CHAT domain-containing protein